MITVEARLQPKQFRRLMLIRHLQRGMFYLYAFNAAFFTALVVVQNMSPLLLLPGWVPFVVYIGVGVYRSFSSSSDPEKPFMQKVRYEFSESGLTVSGRSGTSSLAWTDFSSWTRIVGCVVLSLRSGQFIAFPEESVGPQKAPQLERLLNEKIRR